MVARRLLPVGPVALGLVTVGLVASVALRRFVFVVAVRGRSMTPTYLDGARVLAVRSRRVRPGDVVVFRPPPRAAARVRAEDGELPMVKRVAAVGPCAAPPVPVGHIDVRGDAPRSLDSSVIGPVPLDHVLGRGVRWFARPAPGNRVVGP